MRSIGVSSRGLASWGVAAAVAWALLGTSPAPAQDLRILLSRDRDGKQVLDQHIDLRPNVPDQRAFILVENLTDNVLDDVIVSLLQLTPEGVPVKVLATKTLSLSKREKQVVLFADPKPAEVKPGAAPPPLPLTQLVGPPFKMRVTARKKSDPDDKAVPKEIPVLIVLPSERVKVGSPQFTLKTKDGTNRLEVSLTSLETFVDGNAPEPLRGQPCTVELVLLPEHIKGLIASKRDGVYLQKLYTKDQKAQLVANNLQFEGGEGPPQGTIYLKIDGFERAYTFRIAFNINSTGQEQPVSTADIRLVDKRPASQPVKKLPLRLEVDNPASLNVGVQVWLDRNKDGKFEENIDDLQRLRGPRRQQIGVSTADPLSSLVFRTEVQDWQLELDTEGIYGKADIQVRLLDVGGQSVKTASGSLLFDDTPPVKVDFAPDAVFPRQLVRGKPLEVRATGMDDDSGISQVAFFLGKPAVNKDGKLELPPNTEKIPGAPAEKNWWSARIDLPTDRKGWVDLTVLFVNGVGQPTYRTIRIELVEPGGPAGGAGAADVAKKYKVEGKVVEGSVPQPGLDVFLRDDKGAVKAAAKTNDGKKDPKMTGMFKFENVAPGVYTVTTSKVASMTAGAEPVSVETSDVKDVEVKLYR